MLDKTKETLRRIVEAILVTKKTEARAVEVAKAEPVPVEIYEHGFESAEAKVDPLRGPITAIALQVGVGREGFGWNGRAQIRRKAAWPTWTPPSQMILRQPFQVAGVDGEFDVMAPVKGGGLSGQAGAVKHGISKALQLYDPDLRGALKAAGFLTRDARVVERKKYGRRKARRSFQFSKR